MGDFKNLIKGRETLGDFKNPVTHHPLDRKHEQLLNSQQ